jgi:hypothetical protein
MDIAPFSQDGDFGPDDFKAMSIALDEVCGKLNLAHDQQEEREVLLKRIIDPCARLRRTQSSGATRRPAAGACRESVARHELFRKRSAAIARRERLDRDLAKMFGNGCYLRILAIAATASDAIG